MASRSDRHEVPFPLDTELRCGSCFKLLGMASIADLTGRVEILCTRRSRQETCKTLNIYEGTPRGTLKHTFNRVQDGEGNDR